METSFYRLFHVSFQPGCRWTIFSLPRRQGSRDVRVLLHEGGAREAALASEGPCPCPLPGSWTEGARLQPWAGDPRLGAVGHRPGQRPHWSALPCIYLTEIGHCRTVLSSGVQDKPGGPASALVQPDFGLKVKALVASVMSDSLGPHGLYPPGSSVHGILQARILEWVAIHFSRGSSQPKD